MLKKSQTKITYKNYIKPSQYPDLYASKIIKNHQTRKILISYTAQIIHTPHLPNFMIEFKL